MGGVISSFITFLEKIQSSIDVERYAVFGQPIDKLAHFLVVLGFVVVADKFNRKRVAVILSLVFILAKEVMDLGVVLYYIKIPYRIWLDSGLDLIFGIAGVLVGILCSKYFNKVKKL